eukprot:scaffold715_cov34-Prasinocladus_malaysianus.AAC.1
MLSMLPEPTNVSSVVVGSPVSPTAEQQVSPGVTQPPPSPAEVMAGPAPVPVAVSPRPPKSGGGRRRLLQGP